MTRKKKRRRKTSPATVSSSCIAESNCIQGREAVGADPYLSPCPNWADHLIVLVTGEKRK